MAGINSGNAFGGIPAASMKSHKELAGELGTHRETITAIKSGGRGMSVDLARRVAAKSGEKAATVYLRSQIASLKVRAATKALSRTGTLGSAQVVMKNLTTKFRDEEIDRSDPQFKKAALELKAIAEAALDLAEAHGESMGGDAATNPNPETVYATGASVAPALKSTRDAQGVRIKDGERVERDAQGRRIRD